MFRNPPVSIKYTLIIFFSVIPLLLYRALTGDIPFVLPARIVTGVILLSLVIFQFSLLFCRYFKIGVARKLVNYHLWAGIATLLFYALHVDSLGYKWTFILNICFIILVVSSFLGPRSINYANNRAALHLNHGIHTLAGVLVLALGFWHAIVALMFE